MFIGWWWRCGGHKNRELRNVCNVCISATSWSRVSPQKDWSRFVSGWETKQSGEEIPFRGEVSGTRERRNWTCWIKLTSEFEGTELLKEIRIYFRYLLKLDLLFIGHLLLSSRRIVWVFIILLEFLWEKLKNAWRGGM